MGARQSKLKKELEALKQQVTLAKTKHDAEVEALKSDKRVLEFKLNVLQELVLSIHVRDVLLCTELRVA